MTGGRLHLTLLILLIGIIALNAIVKPTTDRNLKSNMDELKSVAKTIHSNDFSFLKEKLSKKRIVLLGEQTHADGTAFELKGEMIKYLHDSLGFDVVLYEAGLYDMWKMSSDKDTLNPSVGLYSFWWDNDESKAIWEYYRKQNGIKEISLGGFDIQFTGSIPDSNRTKDLEVYLSKKGINYMDLPGYSLIRNKMSKYFYPYYAGQLSSGQKKEILADLVSISKQIETFPTFEDKVCYRYINGIANRYESVWKESNAGSPFRMHIRDSLMADNLMWLADSVYSDKRIIVWLSNLHALHSVGDSTFLSFKTLGERIKPHFDDEMYSILFSSYARVKPDGSMYNRLSNKSVEYFLYQNNVELGYLDFHEIDTTSFLKRKFVSGINQGISGNANWSKMTDLMIFVDKMIPIK